MTLVYGGARLNDALPTIVNPEAATVAMPTVATRQLTLAMGHGVGTINGISFTMEHSYEIHSMLGSYELWEISNASGMDHPFHQHVNAAQVLSISGGDAGYAELYTQAPAWKDTVIVPKWGSVTLLVPVLDWPGMTMFHCHIPEHEDIGMMGMWHIMGSTMPM